VSAWVFAIDPMYDATQNDDGDDRVVGVARPWMMSGTRLIGQG
jgi:hypothetical protein